VSAKQAVKFQNTCYMQCKIWGFPEQCVKDSCLLWCHWVSVSPCFKEMHCHHHYERSKSPENPLFTLPDPDMKAVWSFKKSRNTILAQCHISENQNPNGTYLLNKMAKSKGGVAAQKAQSIYEIQQPWDLFNQQEQRILVLLLIILKWGFITTSHIHSNI
jgi:hypothetical protein